MKNRSSSICDRVAAIVFALVSAHVCVHCSDPTGPVETNSKPFVYTSLLGRNGYDAGSYNFETGEWVYFTTPISNESGISLSHNGSLIAVSGHDSTFAMTTALIRSSDRSIVRHFDFESRFGTAFSPNGRWLASFSDTFSLINLKDGSLLLSIPQPIYAGVFNRSGKLLYLNDQRDLLILHLLESPIRIERRVGIMNESYGMRLAWNERFLIYQGLAGAGTKVIVHDLHTDSVVALTRNDLGASELAVSPDGRWAAFGAAPISLFVPPVPPAREFYLIDFARGLSVDTVDCSSVSVPGYSGPVAVAAVVFSFDSRYVFGGYGRTFLQYDVLTSTIVRAGRVGEFQGVFMSASRFDKGN